MKTSITLVLLFVYSFVIENLHASDGQTVYQEVCASCHGAQAQGNDTLGSPALAGQHAAYLNRQFEHFIKGTRGGAAEDNFGQQMAAISKTISDPLTVKKLSSYLSELPPVAAAASAGDTKNGFKYYQTCGSCHGAKAEGNQALNAPRLTGLSEAYLKRQHTNFVNGLRGSDAQDKYGRQMKMMAGTIRDEKVLIDIIAYITSLDPNQ